jgi:hypothetical protein
VIPVYDEAGNVIDTHERAGDFNELEVLGSFTDCRSRRSGGAFVTRSLSFIFSSAATFESRGFQSLENYDAMNWRKFVLLGCVAACVFAASTATPQMRAHGNSVSRMGMRRAFTPRSIARMPMHRPAMMNSALGLRRFNRFNDGDFDRDHRFRRFDHFKEIIFIGDFGFPWWWGPWWDWNWGYYPYGAYGYSEYSYPTFYPGYGYEYGNYGYGYGSSGYGYQYSYPYGSYYSSYYSGTNYENDD